MKVKKTIKTEYPLTPDQISKILDIMGVPNNVERAYIWNGFSGTGIKRSSKLEVSYDVTEELEV